MNTIERFSPAERKALEFARESPFYEELFEAFLRLQEDHLSKTTSRIQEAAGRNGDGAEGS